MYKIRRAALKTMDVWGILRKEYSQSRQTLNAVFWKKRGAYPFIEKWGDGELAVARQFLKAYIFFARIFLYVSMKRWSVCIGQRQLAFIIL